MKCEVKMSVLKMLLRRQRKLGERIDAAKEKFGKTSTANKTEKYFHTRTKEMQQWWAEFRDNHKAVMEATETCNEKAAYVAEKYFEEIKQRKETTVDAYIEYASAKYPKATFVDVDKETSMFEKEQQPTKSTRPRMRATEKKTMTSNLTRRAQV